MKKMEKMGKRKVEEQFTIEHQTEETIAVYKRYVKRKQ